MCYLPMILICVYFHFFKVNAEWSKILLWITVSVPLIQMGEVLGSYYVYGQYTLVLIMMNFAWIFFILLRPPYPSDGDGTQSFFYARQVSRIGLPARALTF